jgi:hypothetical protein
MSQPGNLLLRFLWVKRESAARREGELQRLYRRKLIQKGRLGTGLWIMLQD